jgi:hypothetical protein
MDPQSIKDTPNAYNRWLTNRLYQPIEATDDSSSELSQPNDATQIQNSARTQLDVLGNSPQIYKIGGRRQALKDNLLEYY